MTVIYGAECKTHHLLLDVPAATALNAVNDLSILHGRQTWPPGTVECDQQDWEIVAVRTEPPISEFRFKVSERWPRSEP